MFSPAFPLFLIAFYLRLFTRKQLFTIHHYCIRHLWDKKQLVNWNAHFVNKVNLITKMRLGGRCLVRESPSRAKGPWRWPWQLCTAHHQDTSVSVTRCWCSLPILRAGSLRTKEWIQLTIGGTAVTGPKGVGKFILFIKWSTWWENNTQHNYSFRKPPGGE